jgi:O-antigen ligase
MAKRANKTNRPKRDATGIVEAVLLGLCLCVLALRATYTEAPTAQAVLMADSLTDTIYSLTLSGLLIFAFVFWVCWSLYANRARYRFSGMEIGLAVFCLAAVLSAAGASDKRGAITYTAMLLGPVSAGLLLIQILAHGRRSALVLMVVTALGVVAAYQCAEQFLVSNAITIEQYEKDPQALLGPLGIEGSFQQFLFEHRLYSRGIRGFFTTSNSAASFGILASFAAVALLVERWRGKPADDAARRRRWLTGLALLIVVAGFLLTRSKGGTLGFVLAVLLLGALWASSRWSAGKRRVALGLLFAAGVLTVAGLGFGAVRYGLRHGRLPGGNSMLVRWQYWTASARMVADHPLVGVGPGNFTYYYPHYKPPAALESVSDPHCFPLSILAQYGPLGLFGFLAMIVVPLARAFGTALRDPPSARDDSAPPARIEQPLAMLGVICGVLLLVRPMLLGRSGEAGLDVLVYEVTTLYVAPVAAFLIGFLLLALPLEDDGRRAPHARRGFVGLAALACAVVGVLAHNLIDFALFEPGVWTTVWIVLACLVAAGQGTPDARGPAARSATPLARVATVCGAILFLAYALLVWRPVYATTTRMQQAQSAAAIGRFDRAHQLLAAASRADPLCASPAYLDGRLYNQEHQRAGRQRPDLLEAAARRFQEAMAVNSADYKNYEKLGDVYGELRQWREACEWYAKAADLYPGCGRLWFKTARVAEMLREIEAALGYYQRAVEIEDSYRRQFRQMYPEREKVVSRLGQEQYNLARRRIEQIAGSQASDPAR